MSIIHRFSWCRGTLCHAVAFATLLGFTTAQTALVWAESGPVGGALAPARPAPGRIVSMVPSITETLFALGAGDRVVGVSTYCDYPVEARALPRVGTFVAPVAEVIVDLEPDLVLTSPSPGNENVVRTIERAGATVAVVYGDAGLAEVRSGIARVAALIGATQRGRALVADLDAEVDAVRAAVEGKARPRVAVVVGHQPLVLAGPASYLGEIVEIAGGENVAASVGGRWPRVGWEFLLASMPEVVIDVSMGGEAPPSPEVLRARWNRFPDLPAVAAGRIFGHGSSFLLLRPGPRLGQAARAVQGMLHGEAEAG